MDRNDVLKWTLMGLGAGTVGYGAVWAYRNPMAIARRYAWAQLRALGALERRVGYSSGSVRYFRVGARGAPLVIVHGLADLPASWFRVVSRLRDRFRIALVEQPLHGESTAIGGYSIEKAADALEAAIVAAFPRERVSLVGNSLGGWVSCRYAARRPERLERLVLVNAGGMRMPVDLSLLLPETTEDARRAMIAVVGAQARSYPRFIHDAFRRELWAGQGPDILMATQDEPPLEDALPKIRVPTFVLSGEADGLIPPAHARRIAELIPDATLRLMPHLAHAPHVSTAPELTRHLLAALESG